MATLALWEGLVCAPDYGVISMQLFSKAMSDSPETRCV